MAGREDADTTQRSHKAPYTSHNPIPTIQRYREEREQRQELANNATGTDQEGGPSKTEQAVDAYKDWRAGRYEGQDSAADGSDHPYRSENKNYPSSGAETQEQGDDEHPAESSQGSHKDQEEEDSNVVEDTSQVSAERDPRKKRKGMTKRKDERADRQVTDPITHLPITIHDFTSKDLANSPENEPASGTHHRSATSVDAKSKTTDQLREEAEEGRQVHHGMERLFPPPEYDMAQSELVRIYRMVLTVGLAFVLAVMVTLLLLEKLFESSVSRHKAVSSMALLLVGLGLGATIIWGLQDWTEKKVRNVWENYVWEAERKQGKKTAESDAPESVQWLNSLLASIWPLVNPDLFTSLADTLEDVMQASLPKLVRMVSVDDIGQGSEALRILGARWLPTGAAAKSVREDGKLSDGTDHKQSDRRATGEGEVQDESNNDLQRGDSEDEQHEGKGQRQQKEQDKQNVSEGMEAEEGDFVNIEIAFAYRARTDGKGIRDRAKNAHLYLAFYLPANIKLPVWVELEGLVGIMRLRLQLTPDPPFFALCTLTFLGQPKVDLSCVPLTRRGLNIMDLPLISKFVQSSVDAAMAEYVAPKSLTLDLKDMLVGDDFKKDTNARGVLVIHVKRAYDFKEGDASLGFLKRGSADSYISVGWAKFGKPVWSTRVIVSEMEPCWNETAFVLVSPEELNVDERLRVQLWDSDRNTADDDLGRIELDLKMLMRDPHSNGSMWDRQDGFKSLKAGDGMPGKLEWSVGYYSKTNISDSQIAQQTADPSIKTMSQLEDKVHEESTSKLREAKKDEASEIEQQKAHDFKARQDQMLISAPPPEDHPSGILSIQIHQITGLELEAVNKNKADKNEDASDEEEEGDDLPSSYCTIILNHQKIFRTRTKPKNAKPFFNASCERFIRDWHTAEVHLSVRDARIHEDDPLIGVVYLPLHKIFEERSQINDFFPLSGGVGFGRVRVSMVFRAVQLQAPKSLLGWEYGTLEVQPEAYSDGLPNDLRSCRLKIRTSLGKGKLHAHDNKIWQAKHGRSLKLPVRKRYSSAVVIEFRSASKLLDKTPAFAVLWLSEIPDDEEQFLTLPVWKGDLKRAETCCLDHCGDRVGSLQLKMTFWRGLSGYHDKLASKDHNLADVMEVLDTANEVDLVHEMEVDDNTSESDSGSDSDSASGSERGHESTRNLETSVSENRDEEDLSKDGKRNPMTQLKEYREHKKQLHRSHRGLMQWKGPRTLKWMKHKVEHGEQRISSLFHHHEREADIETEV